LNITGANTFLAAASTTTGRTLTVNAVIAGATTKNLVLAGPVTSDTGTINLGGANTFSGTTTFSAGATGGALVNLKNRLAFQNSTVVLSPDANLIFDSSVSANAFTFGGLAASTSGTGSNLALRNNASTPIALTVGGNNQSTTYRGALSGGGSLIKTGSGTLTLAGTNTYTGNTTVSAGTLLVDGSTTSPTTVNSGATLTGNGLVNATVTVATGGTLAQVLTDVVFEQLQALLALLFTGGLRVAHGRTLRWLRLGVDAGAGQANALVRLRRRASRRSSAGSAACPAWPSGVR
jgi:autotransporter-associated beta strand protein